MTLTRILSGVIFFALLLLGLFHPLFFWIPPIFFLFGSLAGVWEFSHLAAARPPRLQLALSMLGAVALLADGYFFRLQHGIMIVGLLAVLTIAAGLPLRGIDIAAVAGKSVTAPVYVALPLAMILTIWRGNLNLEDPRFPNPGAHYILFLIFVTWASDTGAYFAGKQFGKRKVLPRLSPGKTLEGYIGGVALTLVVAAAFKLLWNNIDAIFDWADILILALAFSILAPIGDLAESRLKRAAEIKDSGRTFTGHGGMLDIIDSLLFTTLFYYLYLYLRHPDALGLG